MNQLIQPNLTVVGQPGLCLSYTEDVFQTPHLYSNAAQGWQETQYKHTDQPPADLSVPIWFSFKDPDWHVCVWAAGVIYTTTANGMKQFNSIQALLNFMNNGAVNEQMVYLGWSEDLATIRIVEEEAMLTDDITQYLYGAYTGREANQGELDSWRGRDTNTLVVTLVQSQEAHDYYNWVQTQTAQAASVPNLQKQITDLTKQLTATTKPTVSSSPALPKNVPKPSKETVSWLTKFVAAITK